MDRTFRCKLCSKEFRKYLCPAAIRAGKGKYCSEGCRKEALSKLCTRRKWVAGIHKGESNPNWKGGVSTQNKLERSKFRQTIQKQVFERDNYTCQMCGIRGVALQVDHIQSWAEYVELRFDINNCRTLCMECHYKITFGKEKPQGVVWGHNLKNCYHSLDNN